MAVWHELQYKLSCIEWWQWFGTEDVITVLQCNKLKIEMVMF